ncbi:DinB family protein [Phycisphaeraceae bacterium D3-23]
MSQASVISDCAARVSGLGDALLNGIDAQRAARFANGSGGPINANHPVFVYGHLSLYNAMLITMLGKDASDAKVPDTYEGLFKHGVECVDDPQGEVYPSLAEVVTHFKRGTQAAIKAVESCTDEELDAQTPEEGFRSLSPTVGGIANFLLNDHTMFHLGQVSTWRRCEGLGSAM